MKTQDDFRTTLVNNSWTMEKSLQELRDFSSQLYNVADYCETTFFKAEDKTIVMEMTKEYISKAVVTVVDHLGSISAGLEFCLSKSNTFPETEDKIDILKLRLATCQDHSHKLSLARFFESSEFVRHHSRYILPPLTEMESSPDVLSRDTKINSEAKKSGTENQFETEEPLFLHTYNCKPSLVEKSLAKNMDKNNGFSPAVLAVRDGQSILPRTEESTFQFQESQKLKRNTMKWKLMQNKDIATLVRRGKRVLA